MQQAYASPAVSNNPYSKSLWYYSRGDSGEEIRRMQFRNDTRQVLMNEKVYEEVESAVGSENGFIEPENEPSFQIPPRNPRREYDKKVLPETPQNYHYLKNPLRSTCKSVAQSVHLVQALKDSMVSYTYKNGIVASDEYWSILFGNTTALANINQLFIEKLPEGVVPTVTDHLVRALHIYPSYLSSSVRRGELALQLESDPNYGSWLVSIGNLLLINRFSSFHEALMAPQEGIMDLLALIEQIDDVRIQEMAAKITESPQIDHPVTVLLVPDSWKNNHHRAWAEISKKNATDQVAGYLKYEIKAYLGHIDSIKKQTDSLINQMKVICQHNFKISTLFNGYSEMAVETHTCSTPQTELFFENSITTSYELYSEKTQHQLEMVAKQLVSTSMFLNTRTDMLRALIKQMLGKNLVHSYDTVRQLEEFLTLLKQAFATICHRSISLITEFFATLLEGHQCHLTITEIVDHFTSLKRTYRELLEQKCIDIAHLETEIGRNDAVKKVLRMYSN